MSAPSPEERAVATRVIARATALRVEPEEIAQGVDAVCAQLLAEMTLLLGNAGVHALVARALHLTRQRCSALELAHDGDGCVLSVRALASHIAQEGPPTALACASLFLAQMTSLLARFIGDDLTQRLISRLWPEAWEESTRAEPS